MMLLLQLLLWSRLAAPVSRDAALHCRAVKSRAVQLGSVGWRAGVRETRAEWATAAREAGGGG